METTQIVGNFWGQCGACRYSIEFLICRKTGSDWVSNEMFIMVADERHVEGKCETANTQLNELQASGAMVIFFCMTHKEYTSVGNCDVGKERKEFCTMRQVP